MTLLNRWSVTVTAAALMAGLSGPAWAGSSPEEVTAALNKLLAAGKGATFTLGAPTASDGAVVYNNVVVKSSEGDETKIEVLTVGNPSVEGDTLKADAIVAEKLSGSSKGDSFEIGSIELTGPVFTGKDTGNRLDAVAIEAISVTQTGKAPVVIDSAGVDLSDYANDVPHSIDLSVDGIVVDPATVDETGQFAGQLKAMGYDKLTFGFYGSGSLDEASGDLVVNEITLDGTDLGTVTLAGTFGGLTTDLIRQVQQPNSSADLLSKVTLKTASVFYGDASLAGRMIAMQAKQMGQEPAAFVAQISGAMPLFLSVIGNPAFQDKVASSVSAFLKDPKNLTVSAEPAAPVPLMDLFVTSQTAPQTLPDVLKADVIANQPESATGTDAN